MPRMNPFRKKNTSLNDSLRDRKKQNYSFLQELFFPRNKPSESSVTEALIEQVSPIWETDIVPSLISSFGIGSTLYAIFYAPNSRKNKVILEIWDPHYVENKPSQVFELKGIKDIVKQLPNMREKAQILTLKNWD